LKEAYEPLLAPYMKRHSLTAPAAAVIANRNNTTNGQDNQPSEKNEDTDLGDFVELATQAATQAALETVGYGAYNGQTDRGSRCEDFMRLRC
jgi:hypothetical protein